MININEVKKSLAVIAQLDESELEEYNSIISVAVSTISSMINEEHHADERAIYLSATKANYDLSLVSGFGDGITSFSAGDVKITQNSNKSSAKALLDNAMANAHDLVCDNGFAFLGV